MTDVNSSVNAASAAGLQLGQFAAQLDWKTLPQSIREKAVDHIVDTVGVMFTGIAVASCSAARVAARGWGAADEATMVGIPGAHAAPTAAFINALHGRIHTYDDTY